MRKKLTVDKFGKTIKEILRCIIYIGLKNKMENTMDDDEVDMKKKSETSNEAWWRRRRRRRSSRRRSSGFDRPRRIC